MKVANPLWDSKGGGSSDFVAAALPVGAAASLIISLWAHAALASLIGLTVGGSTDALVSINTTTGAITTIGNGLPDGFLNDSYALNSASARYYYQAGGALDVINTTSGALLGSYGLSTPLHGMAYDPTSGTLLGLTVGGSTDALVSINPATGGLTTIGTGNLPVGLNNAASALNPAAGQFYYQANGKLNVVSETTGALLGSYTLSTTLDSLTYDPATGALLALTDGGVGDQLVSVNPSNGAITPIGSDNLPDTLSDNAYALDATAGQFFYQSGNQLVVVNSTTGILVDSPSLLSSLYGLAVPGVTATPEPSSVAVLLVGLGTLGLLQYGFRSGRRWESGGTALSWANTPAR